MLLEKVKKLFVNKVVRFGYLNQLGFYRWMSDEKFLKYAYRVHLGKKLDLEHPVTFNEKMQWLKLYDRRPEYTTMVDKYAVKQYVAEKIGEEYIIPTLGVWDTFDDIDFDTLPEQFVLKCTHDSGGLVICTDKSKLDKDNIRGLLGKYLKRDYYSIHREWPYKNVKPRIIAEAYMEDSATSELRDYKFFCFNGEPKVLYVITERKTSGHNFKLDYFDMDFQHLDFKNGYENSEYPIDKPLGFEKMKELAVVLSNGIPYVRVDFYEVDGKIYFGELTFFPTSGYGPFDPEEWDYKFGEWITLPQKTE